MKSAFAILISSWILAACIPARLLDTPGISGTVMDAEGERPIPGATVRLAIKSSGFGRSPVQQSTVTTAAGTFAIPPGKKWSVLIAGADYIPLRDNVEVVAPGYEAATAAVTWSVTGRSTVSIGSVRLEKVSQ